MNIGDPKTLGFEIKWAEKQARGTADEASRGRLLALIDQSPIWDQEDEGEKGVSWSLVEMLEYLTYAWPYLKYEECDPLGLCSEPARLRAGAEDLWQEVSATERVTQQRQLRAFEECHDLSRAFQGLWLPVLWIQRSGRDCWVISDRIRVLAPHQKIIKILKDLGAQIAGRLVDLNEARAEKAVADWNARDHIPVERRLTAATGLQSDTLAKIAAGEPLEEVFELQRGRMPSELVAVARMTGHAVAPASMAKLLSWVRNLPGGDRTKLDALSKQAGKTIKSEQPFDQGCELAHGYRQVQLGLDENGKVDPEHELARLGVKIEAIEFESHLDAVSVWGEKRGPVVMTNPKGRHSQNEAGRRATLAHELCHLLIDRNGALPFAEVMGGRLPKAIEARARAFAAELLLPKDVAGKAFENAKKPNSILAKLRKQYGVSKEIVAWQARNSDSVLGAEVRAHLRTLVTHPGRF